MMWRAMAPVGLVLALSASVLAADNEETRVQKEAQRIRESDNEAWRQIPWTATLLDAAKAAQAEDRLMFVFSHEGNIDTGRC